MRAKPTLLITEPDGFSPTAKANLATEFHVVEGPFLRKKLLEVVQDAVVVFVRLGHRFDSELLEHAPRLSHIASPTTALTHIDEVEARARGINIVSLRGETTFLDNVFATGEHTFALMLALLRAVPASHRSVCAGEWDRDRFRRYELNGRCLGIIGYGRVGRKVAGYAGSFGMKVIACDPRADLPDMLPRMSIDEVCANSDIVSLHATMRPENVDMFGSRQFALMCNGSLFINTARGELVDEEALLAELISGRLGGAALDVLKAENSVEARHVASAEALKLYARTHDNLILTPHVAGATFESMEKTEVFISERLLLAWRLDRANGRFPSIIAEERK